MEPSILFEDDAFIVLDKPSGITVNNSETTIHQQTVQDFIENKYHLAKNAQEESDFSLRSGIVHRLDKETSGILLVAKNKESFENLQSQFKERTIKKTYLALAHGMIKPEKGEIRVPVGRLPWNRKQFGVIAGGREAVTFYEVIKYVDCHFGSVEKCSLLELYPQTGRTHQIRVHLKYINHPIISDFLYAGRKTARNDRKVLGRVFLHAHKITLHHPISGEEQTYVSPLPKELEAFLSQ